MRYVYTTYKKVLLDFCLPIKLCSLHSIKNVQSNKTTNAFIMTSKKKKKPIAKHLIRTTREKFHLKYNILFGMKALWSLTNS